MESIEHQAAGGKPTSDTGKPLASRDNLGCSTWPDVEFIWLADTNKSTNIYEIPLTAEVLGGDQFARTGATEMEVLAPLRAGIRRTALLLLAVLRLRRYLGESPSLMVDSEKEAKELIS